MEPKPDGRREPPPSRALTTLGAAAPGGKRVVVHLSDEAEERAILDLFRLHQWTAIPCRGDLLDAVDEEEPLLCITDAEDLLVPLTLLKGDDTVVLAIIPNTGLRIRDAWDSGADWVETRPLDFDRPNGLRAFAAVKG